MRVPGVTFLIFAALALLGAAPGPAYQEGQVWEYRNRPVDAGSLLRIQRIEHMDIAGRDETIYHLSIIGVHFSNVHAAGGALQHIPVSQGTLDASVTHLSSQNPEFPDPTEGIAEWRRARGGVFTITVAQIVESVDVMFSQPSPQHSVS